MWWTIGLGILGVLVLLVAIGNMSPMRRAVALNYAAQRAAQRKDWPMAVRLCEQSHAMAGKLRDPQKSQIESSIEIQQATLLYRQGKMSAAEELFRKGFSKARACGHHAAMTPAHMAWGDLCADAGRYIEAEEHYRTAIDGEQKIGNVAAEIFVLQRLGDTLIRLGRRADAEQEINRAIELESRVVHTQMQREGKNPAEHRVVSWSMPDLHFCREEYEDARKLYREKVEFWERSVTRPDNIDLGMLQTRLAISEERSGHPEEAREMFDRAEATIAREWGPSHPKLNAVREARLLCLQQGHLSQPREA